MKIQFWHTINSGELLEKVSAVFSNIQGTKSNEKIMSLAKELSPLVSRHFNDISLNAGLFNRIKAVYDTKDVSSLNSEQKRLVAEIYKGFERGGANLPESKKAELKIINEEIAALHLTFGQNLISETNNFRLVIDNESDLAGISASLKSAAAERAAKLNLAGKWVFGLDNPSIMPFLQQSENKAQRKIILDAYLNRCNNGNTNDNKEVIRKLISLRLKKAQILGYENFAQYQLDDRMAKTPEAVYELLNKLWKPALNSARNELADMRSIADADGVKGDLGAEDWRYYFEKSMAKKFNLSDSELRPYFKLENVREGIFYVANQLYGITFTKLETVPMPNDETTAFECRDADGSHLGILFMVCLPDPERKEGEHGAAVSVLKPMKMDKG